MHRLHGLKRGARDVSTAAKLELRLDFSRTLLILARDGFFQKLLFKIHVYGIEHPGASRFKPWLVDPGAF